MRVIGYNADWGGGTATFECSDGEFDELVALCEECDKIHSEQGGWSSTPYRNIQDWVKDFDPIGKDRELKPEELLRKHPGDFLLSGISLAEVRKLVIKGES
jgi:hypothetical protein